MNDKERQCRSETDRAIVLLKTATALLNLALVMTAMLAVVVLVRTLAC